SELWSAASVLPGPMRLLRKQRVGPRSDATVLSPWLRALFTPSSCVADRSGSDQGAAAHDAGGARALPVACPRTLGLPSRRRGSHPSVTKGPRERPSHRP